MEPGLIGGAAIDATGSALPPATLELCRRADAVLLGAVGGPRWSPSAPVRPEQGLLAIRKELGLYANLRPVAVNPRLLASSPLRPELLDGVDLIVVRELTGGIYYGTPRGIEGSGDTERGTNTMTYTRSEIARIGRMAFHLASQRRKKVSSVDKSNVLETSQLWRKVMVEVAAGYPGIELEHVLVDNCAMQLVLNPRRFDVVVTENMFGDILSDEAAMLTGSLGMLPSASLAEGTFGMYEPSGGSAPDIAGQGIANPIAQILSAAMMLKFSFGMQDAADAIDNAVAKVLDQGYRTRDIFQDKPGEKLVNTKEMGDAIIAAL
jgi:3-isopropylmalate dehydrogenase